VESRQGSTRHVTATTACIHGDTPYAADFARTIRKALVNAGIDVAAPA
jgi:lactam utilization protein B